jgi:hypothetical protein
MDRGARIDGPQPPLELPDGHGPVVDDDLGE